MPYYRFHFPISLSKQHRQAKLIILYVHSLPNHVGVTQTLNDFCNRFLNFVNFLSDNRPILRQRKRKISWYRFWMFVIWTRKGAAVVWRSFWNVDWFSEIAIKNSTRKREASTSVPEASMFLLGKIRDVMFLFLYPYIGPSLSRDHQTITITNLNIYCI